MNIAPYIEEFARSRPSPSASYKLETVKNLLVGESAYALIRQEHYDNSDFLPENIELSVRAYSRDKDIAISIYKAFLAFLKKKTGIDKEVKFPPISISNSFERLMFIGSNEIVC